MRKILFLIGFGLITNACFSQQKELDSLLNLLSNHSQEDETKFNLLNDIAFDYCDIDPSKGLQMSTRAIALAKKLNKKLDEAKAYSTQGVNLSRLGEDSLATDAYKKSLQIFQQSGDEKGAATVLYNLGEVSFNHGDYFNALEYLQRSSQYFEKKDKEFLENVFNATATIYYSLSNYNKALEYYFKALHISESLGHSVTSATIAGNMGILYEEIKEYRKSLEWHNKALELYKKAGNKNGVATELEGIGNIYDRQQDSLKALHFYAKALEINRSLGNKKDIANNLTNISMVYFTRKNYSAAFRYFPEAVKIYEELDDKTNFSSLLNIIGDTYVNSPNETLLENGVGPEERYFKAIEYNKHAFVLAKQAGSLSNQEKILESLSNIYVKQKNYLLALEAFKQILPLHDSILNNKKKEDITRQELLYDFNKKEVFSTAEIQRQRTVKNAMMAGGGILLVAGLVTFIFYKRRHYAEVQKTEAEFKAQVASLEMKALRAQMNPHFIFNSLHSINKYMLDNDKENASQYLSKFSNLMRLILENSREQEVSLEKDLASLELYLQLECMRFKNTFTYTIDIDPAIDCENTLIPPMLLQPFVENSIIHGVANKKDGLIKIKLYKEKNLIHCVVEDNGVGREKAVVLEKGAENKRRSFGIKITQERLNIINQLKKVRSAIDVLDLKDENNNPRGVRIELSLPYEEAF